MLCCAKECSHERRGQKEIVEEAHYKFGEAEESVPVLPFKSDRRRTVDYWVSNDVAPWGEVISVGQLLFITPGSDNATREMQMSIFINGFEMEAAPIRIGKDMMASRMRRLWSPFSMVEACQVKTPQNSLAWAAFKLTVFRSEGEDECLFFATAGQDALAQRDLWMTEMSSGISRVTKSLFPIHSITVKPLRGVHGTADRILAGYLLHRAAPDTASLVYCELHAYRDNSAEFTAYTDEWCTWGVAKQSITADTIVSSRTREHCTVFGLDEERYSARTKQEKDVWLRAMSNIKVKLTYCAPNPTHDEVEHIREAVHDKVVSLKLELAQTHRPALLPTVPSKEAALAPRDAPETSEDGGAETDAAAPADDSVASAGVPDESEEADVALKVL
mmetsp:Transcript_36697/g.84440  ORF Transcript_36697/g.84440 Transcript_36697/m.84440 type:complete len:389 (-) Transcript_36697:26-1192(-)